MNTSESELALPPVVVLVGDVGVGKSTLVEKITGETGLSSNSDTSFTHCAVHYRTPEIIITDAPGANAMTDRFQQNFFIAQALNAFPVSSIMICVKAEERIDNTIDRAKDYLHRFSNDFSDNMCLVVTQMDKVEWKKERLIPVLRDQFGLEKAICTSIETPKEELLAETLANCGEPLKIDINARNFLRYFTINDNNLKVMAKVRKEVARFQAIEMEFMRLLRTFSGQEQVDLVFEFQRFMTREIDHAKMRVSGACGFLFVGKEALNQVGHIANLTNQLKMVLYNVRVMALGFEANATSNFRKCPFCAEVWEMVDGCPNTTCGNHEDKPDVRTERFKAGNWTFATFTFALDDDNKLSIAKSGDRTLNKYQSSSVGKGCGNRINWEQMAPVSAPPEFRESRTATTEDIPVVDHWYQGVVESVYNKLMNALAKVKIVYPRKPSS